MNISCDVMYDLLPLYAKRNVTHDTKVLVQEHLDQCPACRKKLDKMRSQGRSGSGTRSAKLTAKLQKILPKVTVLFALVAIFSGLWAFLFNPIWLTADEAVVRVEEAEHGGVRFVLHDYVREHSGTNWGDNYGHVWNTTRFDKLLTGFGLMVKDNAIVPLEPQELVIRGVVINDKGGVEAYEPELAEQYGVTERMTEKNHWYENVYEGTLDTLLWDAGLRAPEEGIIEQDKLLVLNFAAMVALTIFCPIGFFVWKKFAIRKYLPAVAVVTGSIAFAEWLLTGCRFVTVCVVSEPYPTLKWIYIIGVSLAIAILSCVAMIRLRKQELNIE